MKRTILTLVLSSSLLTCFAQAPTITADNNYEVGQRQVTYVADTVGIMPGSGGENVTWDFSALKRHPNNDSVVTNYYAPSSTTYAQDFPNANIASNSVSGTSTAFYNMSSSKVEMQGVVTQAQAQTIKQIYSNPHVMYTFPMTYNYSFSDDFAANYTANAMDIYRTGTSTVNADGYGTVIIGNRTFTDVLRLHNITQTRDSVNLGFTSMVTVVDIESWSYLTPGKKEPIITISHVSNSNGTQTVRSKSVTYNSRVASTSVNAPARLFSAVKVYPNPASENCRISLRTDKEMRADVQVVNQLGQTVNTVNNYICRPGENILDLNVESMAKGVYFVHIKAASGVHVEKIVKE